MIDWELLKPRLAAVRYLNTVPLIWGILRGAQRELFDVRLELPSVCASLLARGEADLGIVPVAEVWRNSWDTVPGCCIACLGAVRSILLISKKPWAQVQTLAVDAGSRSSVLLARILLSRCYGAHPSLVEMPPDLETMLERCDAALIIGDAALRIEPGALPYAWLDLGLEWFRVTGLPMVFATWSGVLDGFDREQLAADLKGSLDFGLANMDAIVKAEAAERGFDREMVRRYLTENVRFELGEAELAGREAYLRYAGELK